MSGERQCKWVDKKPLYLKAIGGMKIDRAEWEGNKGAFWRYEETPCKFIADEGQNYCPKHRLEWLATTETAKTA